MLPYHMLVATLIPPAYNKKKVLLKNVNVLFPCHKLSTILNIEKCVITINKR